MTEPTGARMLDRRKRGPGDRITTLVEQILSANGNDRDFAVTDSLVEVGLTSIDMVNLMLSVEAEFDIMFPAADIMPENFRSIASIEALAIKVGADPRPI